MIHDLLEEVGSKNHVQAVVYRARAVGGRVTHDRGDPLDAYATLAQAPMLVIQDKLRMLAGKRPIYLPEAFRRVGGELVSVTPNLRTTVGIDYVATQLGGVSSATPAKYIAVSNNTNAPAAANTATNTTNTRICWGTASATDAAASTSRGEYTALGVARAAATYAHTGSATSFTQTITFTASGACTSLQCAGLFDNSAQNNGTLFCENTYTATSLATNDQLQIAWTLNI